MKVNQEEPGTTGGVRELGAAARGLAAAVPPIGVSPPRFS